MWAYEIAGYPGSGERQNITIGSAGFGELTKGFGQMATGFGELKDLLLKNFHVMSAVGQKMESFFTDGPGKPGMTPDHASGSQLGSKSATGATGKLDSESRTSSSQVPLLLACATAPQGLLTSSRNLCFQSWLRRLERKWISRMRQRT